MLIKKIPAGRSHFTPIGLGVKPNIITIRYGDYSRIAAPTSGA
jgi:hypothetical protein